MSLHQKGIRHSTVLRAKIRSKPIKKLFDKSYMLMTNCSVRRQLVKLGQTPMFTQLQPISHLLAHQKAFLSKAYIWAICGFGAFGLPPRAHEIKQILTGIAGLIDMGKETSFGLVSFDLVPISRCTTSSKLGFFRLRFKQSDGTKSQKSC